MAFTTNIGNVPVTMLDIKQVVMLHDKTNTIDNWLLDTYFPRRVSNNSDTVMLGSLETDAPLAPFVAPCVEGRILSQNGIAKVSAVKPAYLKPKESITPCTTYDQKIFNILRQAGVIGGGSGSLSLGEQMILSQVDKQGRLRAAVDNRVKLMAAELLTTGKCIIRSDDYPENIVDYGRDVNATFTPATPWSAATGATPVQDINTMLTRFNDLTGQGATTVLTSTKVFNTLLEHQDFNDTFVKPFAGINVPYVQTFQAVPGAQFRGYLPGGSIAIWTYDATYTLGGVKKRFIPETFFGVIGGGAGSVVHSQIQNLDAGMQPLEYFDYMWKQPDPSALFMICESSPLVVPGNANMTVGGVGFVV